MKTWKSKNQPNGFPDDLDNENLRFFCQASVPFSESNLSKLTVLYYLMLSCFENDLNGESNLQIWSF